MLIIPSDVQCREDPKGHVPGRPEKQVQKKEQVPPNPVLSIEVGPV